MVYSFSKIIEIIPLLAREVFLSSRLYYVFYENLLRNKTNLLMNLIYGSTVMDKIKKTKDSWAGLYRVAGDTSGIPGLKD